MANSYSNIVFEVMKKSFSNVLNTNLKRTGGSLLIPHEVRPSEDKKLKERGFSDFSEIGFGTYGKIYRAKWSKLDGEVAIKAIDLRKLNPEFINQFLNLELEFVRTVPKHSHVLKFYEIIEQKNDPFLYISMELCPNGDFYEYMVRRQYIPERESCLWFRQLISGVDHIHKNGFAHRDIKFENLLLDQNYNLKITDFGMCCRIKYVRLEVKEVISSPEEIASQTFCGSYTYASPELLNCKPYLPTKNDIWSCGVILYTMLFGNYPNNGEEFKKFIRLKHHCVEVPDSPQVSEECKRLVKDILVDEEDRFTIDQIIASDWFNKEWEPIGEDINKKYFFENLNIPRVMTESFEFTGNMSKVNEYTTSVVLSQSSNDSIGSNDDNT